VYDDGTSAESGPATGIVSRRRTARQARTK
jgi:hypothetical protein